MPVPFQQCSMFPNLELSIGCLPHRMVCRRKEVKGPVQWAQGIGRNEVNRTCTCTCVLSIWQFLGLGNQPARWGNTRSFHSWKLKDEVNLIFSTNFIIYNYGRVCGNSYVTQPWFSHRRFIALSFIKTISVPQLHLCMKETHGVSQSI